MALQKEEQEVTISFGRLDDIATIFASDTTWIKKLDKMCEKNPEFKKIEKWSSEEYAKYEIPKKNVSIRNGRTVILSEEEIERRKERGRNLAKNKTATI